MSSVLKALQQLEKQRSFEKNSIQSDLNTVDALTVIRRQARHHHRTKRRRLIGLIVLVIGVGTLFALAKSVLWNPRSDTAGTLTSKTVATISKPTAVSKVQKAASVSGTRHQKPTSPTSFTDSPAQPVKKKAIHENKRSTASKPAILSRTMPKSDQAVPPVRKQKKPPFRKTKTMPQKTDTRKSKVALKPIKTVTPFPHSPPSEAPKELGLKLRAITWFNNPQKRFTVINDSIIRLGEMVDGFRLTRIEENQVMVEKNNQKWLLKFNRIDYSNVTP